MMLSRRDTLRIGGLLLAGPLIEGAAAADAFEVRMTGNKDGSRVWFEPVGLLIRPGDTIRWINLDKGNAHTSTAYHPANADHPLRIPAGAAPWDFRLSAPRPVLLRYARGARNLRLFLHPA